MIRIDECPFTMLQDTVHCQVASCMLEVATPSI